MCTNAHNTEINVSINHIHERWAITIYNMNTMWNINQGRCDFILNIDHANSDTV